MLQRLKALLPNRTFPTPILRGPFRGAVMDMNPRHSLRKIFGIYEHELNDWISSVIPRVDTVLDVGAADGYFTLGCAAAFRRLKKTGEIIAFEPETGPHEHLRLAVERRRRDEVTISLRSVFVGKQISERTTTLDELARERGERAPPRNTLIKIDVEGAEIDVIEAATSWLDPSNRFLIEVHWDPTFLDKLRTLFSARGLRLLQIDQQPLPLLGYEARGRNQWWLVSDLS